MLRRFLLVLIGLFIALPAWAVEIKGQIKGTVVDPEGLAIPGVVVVATSPSLQGQAAAETDADGRFRLLNLAVGDYRVEATKPGFQSWAAVDVRVGAGSTVTLDVTLRPSVAGEEIIVEEEAPVVDVTSTRTGVTLTKEMLRDIPNAGRDYQGTMNMAPGVVGGGNPNVGGAFDSSNQYYVDGVNTTDPLTNTFSMNMNFDAIQEVQVITGGLDAEYGRALGGAVNIVTRSGGNQVEGDVQLLYSGQRTRLYKPLPWEETDDLEYDDMSAALNVGGPIIKDRLWYFTSLQGNYYVYEQSVPADVVRPDPYGEMLPRIWTSGYLFGKLTWKPHPNHQVWVHGQADPTRIRNTEQDVYTLSNRETDWRQGGWLASLGHLWTVSANSTLESQAYVQNSYIRYMPNQWLDCTEWDGDLCVAYDTNDETASPLGSWFGYEPDALSYGTFPYSYVTQRNRASVNTKYTQYVDFLGQHELKVGLQGEFLRSYSIYPGLDRGYEVWSANGDPTNLEGYTPVYQVRYDSDLEATLEGQLVTAFVQDVWQPFPQLTIRPGVRMDWTQLFNDIGDQVFDSITFAPRFGVAFDPTADGRTKIHAYYGRFYDSGYLGVADIMAAKPGGYSIYYWDDESGDWSDTPAQSTAATFEVSDDLKNPFSDEFDIGVSRDVGNGWGLDLTFVYEEAHNFWEDDEINLIWNDAGTDVIGYRNGTNEAIFRFRTPEGVYTSYTSLAFTAMKQFDDHWGMVGSYTWSRAYGTQNDQGATMFYDIAQQRKYEEGILSYDVPHYVKLAGSYRDANAIRVSDTLGIGFLAGWDFMFRSGYPYRRLYYNAYWDDWINYGDDADDPARLPAISQTNVKAGATVAVGRTTWDLTVEVFNLFNTRTVTSVNNTYGDVDGGVYTDSNGDILFGTPVSYQNPRYLQFGLRGEF